MEPEMTLRDWFAGQAVVGLLSNPSFVSGSFDPDDYADLAYRQADALMCEREKQPAQEDSKVCSDERKFSDLPVRRHVMAKQLGISGQVLNSWRIKGLVPVVRVNKQYTYVPKDVMEALKKKGLLRE